METQNKRRTPDLFRGVVGRGGPERQQGLETRTLPRMNMELVMTSLGAERALLGAGNVTERPLQGRCVTSQLLRNVPFRGFSKTQFVTQIPRALVSCLSTG